MKALSVLAGIVLAAVLIVATAIATGCLAYHGARFAGLPASTVGAFDSAPLDYFIFGGLSGAILFCLVTVGLYFLYARKRGIHPNRIMLFSAAAISLLAFPAGIVCHENWDTAERWMWDARKKWRQLDAQRKDDRNAGGERSSDLAGALFDDGNAPVV